MADYNRSRSYGNEMMKLDTYHESPTHKPSASSYDFSCCFIFQISESHMAKSNMDFKLKKGKKTTISGSSSSKPWSFGDPEFKRKKRVAAYRMYGAEGKVRGSLRRSFRWIKDKYTQVICGSSWW